MPRTPVPILAVLATAAVVAGCGGEEASAPPPAGAAAGAATAGAVEVRMQDVELVPERAEVRAGQTVRWVNDDAVPHTVVAAEGADFASATLQAGDTYEFTPRSPGTISYACTIHPGQEGTLVVTPAS